MSAYSHFRRSNTRADFVVRAEWAVTPGEIMLEVAESRRHGTAFAASIIRRQWEKLARTGAHLMALRFVINRHVQLNGITPAEAAADIGKKLMEPGAERRAFKLLREADTIAVFVIAGDRDPRYYTSREAVRGSEKIPNPTEIVEATVPTSAIIAVKLTGENQWEVVLVPETQVVPNTGIREART